MFSNVEGDAAGSMYSTRQSTGLLPTLLTSRPVASSNLAKVSKPDIEIAIPNPEKLPEVYPVDFRVRNTFIDVGDEEPSLERFYRDRAIQSCPGSHVGRLEELFGRTTYEETLSEEPSRKLLQDQHSNVSAPVKEIASSSFVTKPVIRLSDALAAGYVLSPRCTSEQKLHLTGEIPSFTFDNYGKEQHQNHNDHDTLLERVQHSFRAAGPEISLQGSYHTTSRSICGHNSDSLFSSPPAPHHFGHMFNGSTPPPPASQFGASLFSRPSDAHHHCFYPDSLERQNTNLYTVGSHQAAHSNQFRMYDMNAPVVESNLSLTEPLPTVNPGLGWYVNQNAQQPPLFPAPATAAPSCFAPIVSPAPTEPAPGSEELPSVGSSGHSAGQCKPCAFLHTKGCENGAICRFCHLCGAGEKKRRQKEKRVALRGGA